MVQVIPNQGEVCPNCKGKGSITQTITTSDGRSEEMYVACYCQARSERKTRRDSAVVDVLREGLAYFTHEWVSQPGEKDKKCEKCGEWTGEVDEFGACVYETVEILLWFKNKLKEQGLNNAFQGLT